MDNTAPSLMTEIIESKPLHEAADSPPKIPVRDALLPIIINSEPLDLDI
jgi:hypothetical protein